MQCPNCQTENPSGARFCFNCGQALPQACSNCGAGLQTGARFCHNCGRPVEAKEFSGPPATQERSPVSAETAAPQLSSQAAQLARYIPTELLARLQAARDSRLMQGERRIVTILFCDVAGSTQAASHLDPEEWAEIINGGFARMIEPVYRYEGTVARLMGDGLLAFFGAPIAHEDDPQRAILAGLEITRATLEYAIEVRQRWGIEFNIRVGINTGLVVVGDIGSDLRLEYSALGDAINLAARMEQTALPGSVQVSEATYQLVAPLFEVETIENLQVKGRDELLVAYRILGRKAAPARLRGIRGLDAPMIGRQAQMEALLAAAANLREGRGQVVSVMGEAGLGKSRLVSEFSQNLQAFWQEPPIWLEGRSFSYETATPFAPFGDLLRRYFSLAADMPPATQLERIKSMLPVDSQELAASLATLLGLPLEGEDADRVRYLEPMFLRMQLFQSIYRFVELLARSHPVVLYLDDLHWADRTSLDLLTSLLELTSRHALMILVAFRPRMDEPSWEFHENTARAFSQGYLSLPLAPLDESQARQLVASLLEIEDLPPAVRLKILEKAEGNPFFLEEVIRSLLDGGLIVRRDDHWQATREIQNIEFPTTLVGVITARLDRLEDGVRQILQAASVIGREFSAEILADLLASPETLEPALLELQRREYVRSRTNQQGSYIFKHVLTQEAAYNSILLSNRRELHRRTAESLIRRTTDAAAVIAFHLVEARQTGQAVPYLVQAGERAAAAYAVAEAMGFFQQALEFSAGSADQSLLRRAYEGLGGALSFAGRIPEALELYQEMKQTAESTGDLVMQISALNKLAAVYGLMMGQFQEADAYLDKALELSESGKQPSLMPESAIIRCQMCTARADFESVKKVMDVVVQVSRESQSPWQEALATEHLASSLLYMARFDEARGKATEGLELCRQIGDREHESGLLFVLAHCDLRDGQVQAARRNLEEAWGIAELINSIYARAFSGWGLSACYQSLGLYEQALRITEPLLQDVLPIESMMPFVAVPVLGIVGSLYLEISLQYHDQAIALHGHALRLLETPGGGMMGGPAWADLGSCAIAAGDLEIAEQTLFQGLSQPNAFALLERPRTLCGMAALVLARNDPQAALVQAEDALAVAWQYGMRNQEPLAFLTRGRVQLALGKAEQARADFEQAASLAEALGFRPLLWQARLELGNLLAATGVVNEAQANLDRARQVIDEIAGDFQSEDLRQAFLQANTKRNL